MSILATETASATAGREGKATSADGKINLALSPPGSLRARLKAVNARLLEEKRDAKKRK